MTGKAKLIFPAVMGLMMSFLMSGFVTWSNLGFDAGFLGNWMRAWMTVLPVALVVIYLARPIALATTRAVVLAIWGPDGLTDR